jgi:hypothetical protein
MIGKTEVPRESGGAKLPDEKSSQAIHRASVNIAIIACLLLALIYASLFAANSLTRFRRYSPDAMSQVAAARNIATGRGLVESIIGFNHPKFLGDKKWPQPLTVRSSLFPLALAALAKAGIEPADGALILPAFFHAAILLLAAMLARRLAGIPAALLVLASLAWLSPLREISRTASPANIATTLVLIALIAIATRGKLSTFIVSPAARIAKIISRIIPGWLAVTLCTISIATAIAYEVNLNDTLPVADLEKRAEFLGSVVQARTLTAENDAIIANDSAEIAFYLTRPNVIALPVRPRAEAANYAELLKFLDEFSGQYQRAYLIIHDTGGGNESVAQYRFGPFIADLIAGHMDSYPRVHRIGVFGDTHVFKIAKYAR